MPLIGDRAREQSRPSRLLNAPCGYPERAVPFFVRCEKADFACETCFGCSASDSFLGLRGKRRDFLAGMEGLNAAHGSARLSRALGDLWAGIFPMILPPARADGLGIILLNSNAETHFSFTNALGIMSAEQAHAIEVAAGHFPQACWILALHHHLVEYPNPATALSERIGTALINGSWFVRKMQRLADRTIIMHGHRHVDWIGECGKLLIVSAPSPVMEATDSGDTYFYIHILARSDDNRLRLLEPVRIDIEGAPGPDGISLA